MPLPMLEPDLAIAASFLLPLLASAVLGGMRGGFQANQSAREENQRRLTAQQQRERLENLLARIRHVNYDDVDSAQSAAFTEASNAAAANAAQRGLRGGVVDASQDRVLGQAIADLARFKQQQQQQREQAEGRVLQEPAFDVPQEMLDRYKIANQGALMGILGGSMDVLGPALSSEDVLRSLFQSSPTGNPSESELLAFQENPLATTFGPGRPGGPDSPGRAGTVGIQGGQPDPSTWGQYEPSAGSSGRGPRRSSPGMTGPRSNTRNIQGQDEPEPESGVIGPALQRALVRSRNTRNFA